MQALLHQCRASEYMLTPQQMLPPMLAKVSTIVDNASTIFTFLRSQLPYPYVHLVSFTVHFYLFFWATYMGMLLYTGIPDGSVSQSAPTQPLGVGTSADGAWVRCAPPPAVHHSTQRTNPPIGIPVSTHPRGAFVAPRLITCDSTACASRLMWGRRSSQHRDDRPRWHLTWKRPSDCCTQLTGPPAALRCAHGAGVALVTLHAPFAAAVIGSAAAAPVSLPQHRCDHRGASAPPPPPTA